MADIEENFDAHTLLENEGRVAKLEELLLQHEKASKSKKGISSKGLIQDGEDFISKIEALGVVKLGEMEVPDGVLQLRFHGRSMLTLGSEEGGGVDWKTMWRSDLEHAAMRAEKTMNTKEAEASGSNQKVTVEAYLMRIEHGCGPPKTGFLHSVLLKWQQEEASLSVFSIPAIQAVILYKWEKWAKRLLQVEFVIYVAWMLSFLLFIGMFGDHRGFKDPGSLHHTRYGVLPLIALASAAAFMVPFLVIETCTIFAYRWSWFTQFWNVVDMGTYVFTGLTLFSYVTHTGLDSAWLTVVLAAQCIIMAAKIQYFSRVYARKGSMVDTLKVVVVDIKWFLVFMYLTMFAFGIAFFILYREDRDLDPEFESTWHAVVAMFSYMMGGFHFELFYDSSRSTAVIIFFLIYESIMAIMLVNILIAIMTDSYSLVMEEEQAWGLCSKAQIIDELETALPSFITQKWNPKFLHILKVSPRKEVLVDTLWTKLGMAEDKMEGSAKDTVAKLSRFQNKVVGKLESMRQVVKAMDPDHGSIPG
ncbi:hypothetical protein BSKO_12056 [Bryopsis sp. KO-2023]|nr:hypothetical protein BSKO_12056 [Bryopsis sp. KO-2023]